MCPCNLSFDHGATYDFCRATLAFEIPEGDIEGTDIGELNIVAITATSKVMTDGNWKLGVFIDDRADDEQADKLQRVFTGALGGPMAGPRPRVGGGLGAQRAPFGVRHDGLRHSVRIGNDVDFEVQDIVPFRAET